MVLGRGNAENSPMRPLSVSAEMGVLAALAATAPALDPSGGARSRMRLRLLNSLRPSSDRPSASTRGSQQRQISIAF